MMGERRGRRAVLTGGARGFGAGLGRALAVSPVSDDIRYRWLKKD